MNAEILDRVKRRIDPSGDIWNDIDDQVRDIISDVEDQLRVRLGFPLFVPDSLGYIVTAVAVKQYNRIGSEGTASHTVEGETMTWDDDPFAEYSADIEEWRSANSNGRAHIRFI